MKYLKTPESLRRICYHLDHSFNIRLIKTRYARVTLKLGTRKKTHFLLRGMSFLFLWPILKNLKNNTYAKQSKNYDIIDFMSHIIFKRYNPYFI
jgi:hypothetical protein